MVYLAYLVYSDSGTRLRTLMYSRNCTSVNHLPAAISVPAVQQLSAPVQAKLNAPLVYRPVAPPAQARLNTPPAYRPVVQPAQAKLNTPPVYRPVAQPAQVKLNAPPVYRPVAPPVQAKVVAPPVYRPQAAASAQTKVAATSLSRCQTKAPAIYKSLPLGRQGHETPVHPAGVVQTFKVLGSSKLLDRMPAKRPWFGYPYAVVERANFPAQVLQHRARKGAEFLRGPNRANIEYTDTGTMSLRVSDDNRMAIEDSDLDNRQPKAFYATAEVIDAANIQLQQVQSQFRLKRKGSLIRILPGWSGTENLYKVEPQYLEGGKKKNPNWAPQNCNEMAQKVTGLGVIGMRGGGQAGRAASQIAGFGNRPTNAEEDRLLPQRYVERSFNYRVRSQRANQYALPDVGDAYMIATQGTGTPIPGRPEYQRVRDIEAAEDRELGWSYHFAGVVAQSGNDRITLENFARGDDRQGDGDPRWYFQMYGSSQSQSFHQFHKAKKQYANPITIAMRNPRLPALPATTDLQQEDAMALTLALTSL